MRSTGPDKVCLCWKRSLKNVTKTSTHRDLDMIKLFFLKMASNCISCCRFSDFRDILDTPLASEDDTSPPPFFPLLFFCCGLRHKEQRVVLRSTCQTQQQVTLCFLPCMAAFLYLISSSVEKAEKWHRWNVTDMTFVLG